MMRPQVFHVGQLHSLQSLSLSHNYITDITLGGLAACEHLTDLDVSNNLLQVRLSHMLAAFTRFSAHAISSRMLTAPTTMHVPTLVMCVSDYRVAYC